MTEESQPSSALPPPVDPAPDAAPPAPVAWQAPPPVAWQAPPPVVAGAAAGQRTGFAMAAGILLVLGGIGGILLGLLVATLGSSIISSLDLSQFRDNPDLNGANPSAIAGGVVAFIGAVVVIYSVAYLVAGIGVLRNANWGRVLGIVVGVISGLIWLSGLANRSAAGGGSGAFAFVLLAIHVYIVVALLLFWRGRPSPA